MVFWKNTRKKSGKKATTKYAFSDDELHDAGILVNNIVRSFYKNPERIMWAYLGRASIVVCSSVINDGRKGFLDKNYYADNTPGNNSIESIIRLADRIAYISILDDDEIIGKMESEYELIIKDAIDYTRENNQ